MGLENILLTNGSQTAFFALLNIFAGTYTEDSRKQILFPLTPEYIGYCDQGLEPDMFTACRPRIELLDHHQFKYYIHMDHLHLNEGIGAVCVSRPTNPTGNVLTDREIGELNALALEAGVPLIIDNAYGVPFPNIVFIDKAHPLWNENIIMCMSLSKLGLPATRTGLVIAAPDIIQMLARINAVVSLAPGGFGAAIVTHMVRNGHILQLCRDVIQPYYKRKADFALNTLIAELEGRVPFRIHRPEGAFFLWCWFEGIPISSMELYHRLKAKGVIVVPGEYFFPGLSEPWPHKHECIRVSYAQDEHIVEKGLKIIAEEVLAVYKGIE
jgi:valine--pyruvate aminotransferase